MHLGMIALCATLVEQAQAVRIEDVEDLSFAQVDVESRNKAHSSAHGHSQAWAHSHEHEHEQSHA